jgi:hypothetical protein
MSRQNASHHDSSLGLDGWILTRRVPYHLDSLLEMSWCRVRVRGHAISPPKLKIVSKKHSNSVSKLLMERAVVVAVISALFAPVSAVDNGIGYTPPMGWRVSLCFNKTETAVFNSCCGLL